MALKVAINGFGRIGRSVFRVLAKGADMELVAINDLHAPDTLAYLLKYDSVMGRIDEAVESDQHGLFVGGRRVRAFTEEEPSNLPWGELGVDFVFECTGRFTRGDWVKKHLKAGARKVIISAPAEKADATVVLGVNEAVIDPENHRMISNASCTTNCLAPVAKVIHEQFTIAKGLVTTVHSYTNDQKLLDVPHDDPRRGRAAGVSMIPTTTGAAVAVAEVLPELAGRLDGVSVRVPTPNVSLADITLMLEKPVTKQMLNSALKAASEGGLKGVLGYSEEPLVSIDYAGCPLSGVVDGLQTQTIGGNLVKIVAWYDNEWGYSNRLVELAEYIAERERRAGLSDLSAIRVVS